MAWLLDLDGVVWLAEDPIPGSSEAIARLRAAGHGVYFLTNNSAPTVDELRKKLGGMGVEVSPDDLVTSAQAAASLLEPGSTALVCAGAGVKSALEERGVETVREGAAEAVVVGFHRDFDYARLTAAFKAIEGGARLIGTNDDATYPTPDGPVPGGGALLAAVATAGGVEPEVAGKPYEPFAALVRTRVGAGVGDSIMVGDRPSTDGLMAQRLGISFALVLSGITSSDEIPSDPPPDHVADDLVSLVESVLGRDQESA
ncbi:MAG TPA: HAD-IIA family hydrolase [Acidimicrobiales bacterium]|nr:HAD-IIA family hydrolase [Acidimicrobiales bacterium]